VLLELLDHAIEIGIEGAKAPREPVLAALGNPLAVCDFIRCSMKTGLCAQNPEKCEPAIGRSVPFPVHGVCADFLGILVCDMKRISDRGYGNPAGFLLEHSGRGPASVLGCRNRPETCVSMLITYCRGTSISFSSQCSVINSQRFLSPCSKSAVSGNTVFMTFARSFWTSTSASISR
jgi:hypothetical protein